MYLGTTCLLIAAAAAASAETPLDRLPHDRAGEVVRRAITYAGGWEAWTATRTVQFRKTTIRYRPDGSVEQKRVQLHRYVLRPGLRARIEGEADGKKIVLINNGYEAWKIVDGASADGTQDRNQARNATFGSHYVFHMPFKLTDRGAHLAYVGAEKLPDGTTVDRVRVTYDKGAGDAGGLHTWTYYFEAGSGRLRANHLTYAPGKYDFTEYLDDRPVGALRLSTRRYGYDADAKGKKGSKVSEILYEEIRTNVPLDSGLFAASK